MKITVTTRDGKVFTNPKDVHIERNEVTENFYKMVERYMPKEEKKEEATA